MDRVRMFATAELRSVRLILALTACWSLLAVHGTVAVRGGGHRSVVDRRSSGTALDQYGVCEPPTALDVDVPASCDVCAGVPDRLVAACCRWCFDEKTTSFRERNRDETRLAAADKRAKFFLGKRPKYFLGK